MGPKKGRGAFGRRTTRNDGGKEKQLKVRNGRTEWTTIPHMARAARSAGRRSQQRPGWPPTEHHSGPGIFRAPPENGRTVRFGNLNFLRPPALPMPPAGPAAAWLTLLSVRNVEYGGSGADMVAVGRPARFRFPVGGWVPRPLSVMCAFFRAPERKATTLAAFLGGSWVSTLKDVAARRPHRQSRSLWENVCQTNIAVRRRKDGSQYHQESSGNNREQPLGGNDVRRKLSPITRRRKKTRLPQNCSAGAQIESRILDSGPGVFHSFLAAAGVACFSARVCCCCLESFSWRNRKARWRDGGMLLPMPLFVSIFVLVSGNAAKPASFALVNEQIIMDTINICP